MSEKLEIHTDADERGYAGFEIAKRDRFRFRGQPEKPWQMTIFDNSHLTLEVGMNLSRDDLEYIRDWITEELDAVDQEREDNGQFGVGA